MVLTIGQVAREGRVNVQTLRYYERRGLFPAMGRTGSGYRQYGDDAVRRLRFIKRAQDLGFSLKEITELLALRVRHGGRCEVVARRTHEKIHLVQGRIRELKRIQRTLERLAAACRSRSPTDDCPILEALEDYELPGD